MAHANLHHDLAATMIDGTHDLIAAMTTAGRIVVRDQGRIRQVGAPMEPDAHPADRCVTPFIGSPLTNFLPAIVIAFGTSLPLDPDPGARRFTLNPRQPVPDIPRADLGTRPDHVTLTASDAAEAVLPSRIRLVERPGYQTLGQLETTAGPVTLQGVGDLPARPGDQTALAFDATRAHAFGPDGKAL